VANTPAAGPPSDLLLKQSAMAAAGVGLDAGPDAGSLSDAALKRGASVPGSGFDAGLLSHSLPASGWDSGPASDTSLMKASAFDLGSGAAQILESRGNWPPPHWGEENKRGFFGFDPTPDVRGSGPGGPDPHDDGGAAPGTPPAPPPGGDNVTLGTSGNDVLVGTAGDDFIFGGQGDDTLSGGLGHDGFVFSPHFGRDTITDFAKGDVIDFVEEPFHSFADVQGLMHQAGADVHIDIDVNDGIVLSNVALASLGAGDFRFF
jgi:Ca2+-binding RTX toxin-like protein